MNSAKGSSSGTEPWSQQQGYLTEGWRDAAEIWHKKKDTPYYNGVTLAGPSDAQRQALEAYRQSGSDIAAVGAQNANWAQQLFGNAFGRQKLGDVSASADTFARSGFTPTSSYQPRPEFTTMNAPTAVSYVGSNQPGLERYRAALYNESMAPSTSINYTNSMTGARNPATDPTFLSGLEASFTPVINRFNREVLPGIKSAAITSGAYGGARQDISEGVAAADMARSLEDIAKQAFLEQYGRERQIGSQQEMASTQLAQQTAQRRAELEAQNWATREQLGTQRYTTTEGLRAGDTSDVNKLNTDWGMGQDKLRQEAILSQNKNALDWATVTQDAKLKAALAGDENALRAALASDKNALDWAAGNEALANQRWLQSQAAAAQRNLARDTLNTNWDTSMLNMVPTLSGLGTAQWQQGRQLEGQAGLQAQQWRQAALDDQFNNWLNAQNWDMSNLKQYAGLVQGYNPGLVQNPTKSNPLTSIFGGAMGGAMGGYGLGKATGWFDPQSGGGYGALLGALAGAF
jgi:hypothetical protein